MTDNISQLPTPGVTLDLDAYGRDEKDIRAPFTVKIRGRVVTFTDPDEWDWRETVAIRTPGDMMRSALVPDDLEYFIGLNLKTHEFGKLLKEYSEYYGLKEKFAEAQRQQAFANGGNPF